MMECEYFVYDPKTKKLMSYTYPATIPLKDFYNRKLRHMKSCIVSYNTRETSLIIDNFDVIEYCMWNEALDYFKNKRISEIKKILNQNKKTVFYASILLILLISAIFIMSYINTNYSGLIGVKGGGNLIELDNSLFVAGRQIINDESIIGKWEDESTGCIIIFDSNHGYYSPLSLNTHYSGRWEIENNHTVVMLDTTYYTEYMWVVFEVDSGVNENGTVARGSIKNGELILTSYVTADEQTGFPEGRFRPV